MAPVSLCVLVGALYLLATLEPAGSTDADGHAETESPRSLDAANATVRAAAEGSAVPGAGSRLSASPQDLQAALTAATRSAHRAYYFAEEIVPSDTVFDLCDDAQAAMAGLDVEGKAGARDALGVDCVMPRKRFAYRPRGDALRVVDSYAEAQAQLEALDDSRGSEARGILLGSFGATLAASRVALQPAGEGFAVATASLHATGGQLRGLLANITSQVAHGVTVHLDERQVSLPLSVQPGETVAFEIPSHRDESVEGRLRVQARFEAAPDPNRRVLVGGAPGRWSGSLEAFGRIRPDLVGAVDVDPVRYFETTLVAVGAEGGERHPLRDPAVVAAALSADRRVLAVLRPAVVQWGAWNAPVTELALGEEASVGFVVPPGTEDVLISVGASDWKSEK